RRPLKEMEPVRRVSAKADGGCAVPTPLSRSDEYYERQGDDDQFPPPRLGPRCRFRQRALAPMRRHEQGAADAAIVTRKTAQSAPYGTLGPAMRSRLLPRTSVQFLR